MFLSRLANRARRQAKAGWLTWMAAPIIALAAALNGCGERPIQPPPEPDATEVQREIRVTGTAPAAGTAFDGRWTIVFDGPLGGLFGMDPTAPGEAIFDPPLPGTVRIGENFLTLEANSKYLPQRIFKTRLKTQTVAHVQLAPTTLTLTVFDFKPVMLTRSDISTSETLLNLSFTAGVATEGLAELLTLEGADGEPVPYEAREPSDPRYVQLAIARTAPLPVAAVVERGVRSSEGDFATAERHRIAMSGVENLSVAAKLGERGSSAILDFNDPVPLDAVNEHLKVIDTSTTQPKELDFTLSREFDGLKQVEVHFTPPDPQDVKVRLDLRRGLVSSGDLVMPADWSTHLALRTKLRIERHTWNDDSEAMWLEFTLNYPLETGVLREHLKIDPAVEIRTVIQRGSRSFSIDADWKLNTTYRVDVTPGIEFAGWATLREKLSAVVKTPENMSGWISFPNQEEYYLPGRGDGLVPIHARGFEKLYLTLHRLLPGNIVLAMDEIHEGHVDSALIYRWSRKVGEKSIPLEGEGLKSQAVMLDLDTLSTVTLSGVYCLEANGSNDWRTWRERRLLLMTDLGLLAHWQADSLVLFAHDLSTLDPKVGARVSVYSVKNQLLGETVTDTQGIARLAGFDEALGQPTVAVVEAGEDFSFLKLAPRYKADLPAARGSHFDTDTYDAFMYGDRELYRPGDMAHLRWIVRDRQGKALAGAPLTLEIRKPNGEVMTQQTLDLSEWGLGGFDFATQEIYPTGRWNAMLKIPGSDRALGNYSFQVEEFVPNRMKATLSLDAKRWIAGEGPFAVHVQAEHLFGGAASGRVAEAQLRFEPVRKIDQWPDYNFSNNTERIPGAALGQLLTDEQGRATFQAADLLKGRTQPYRVCVLGQVREMGGRVVNAPEIEAEWFPSPVMLGLALEPAGQRGQVRVRVAAVRPDGTAATDLTTATVELERAEWEYRVRRYLTHHQADLSNKYQLKETQRVDLADGKGETTFPADNYGRYRVRVRSEGNPQFSMVTFFTYDGQPHVSEAGEPQLLSVELNEAEREIGEIAHVRLRSPFDGKGLVVVQSDRFHQVVPVDVVDGTAAVELEVLPEWFPNVWIEATVIHAVDPDQKQVYPFSSSDVVNLKVSNPAREIKVEFMGLPDEVRPRQPIELTVATHGNAGQPVDAIVTLAAVDEGIHLITGYKSPDPLDWFGRALQPDMRYTHYYDQIARPWEAPAAGGDEAGERRLGRLGQNWIETVALWSGEVRTGPGGVASVSLDLPEFNGQLRLVAVAATDSATGSADARLYVRRPWMLQTSLPRFLLPGDKAQALATIYNTTPSGGSAQLELSTSGTLALVDGAEPARALEVPPSSEVSSQFTITAAAEPGQGQLVWTAAIRNAAGDSIEDLRLSQPLPVGEPAAYQTRSTLTVLDPGESVVLDASGFRQDDWTELSVSVGANPLLRLETALGDLVGYPYGCIEQTVSKLMPIYLLREHHELITTALPDVQELDFYLRNGIDRVLAMQTGSGGLSFWPGYNHPYPYGSVYGLHFLTLVRNGREIRIDDNNFEILQSYVRGLAADPRDGSPAGYYLRAYAIYVLSLGGDPEAVELLERFEAMELPSSARYLLAAALAVATHDMERVQAYLNAAKTFAYDEVLTDGVLNSPVRNQAVQLLAMTHMGEEEERMRPLAEKLTYWLESREYRYGNTQEKAMVIAALTNYLQAINETVTGASAQIEGPEGVTTLSGTEVFRSRLNGPNPRFVVSNTGGAAIHVNAVAAGIPLNPATEASGNGVTVGRAYYDRQGTPVQPADLRQGESYIVALHINPEHEVKNFVLSDLLPGGLEVQNPRLAADYDLPASLAVRRVQPAHLEVRDDRLIAVFDQLGWKSYTYLYIVDAVTPGEFQQPPLTGECMYDPATFASSAPGRVVIGTGEPVGEEEP